MYLEITLVLLSAAVLAMVLMIIPLVIYITRFLRGLTAAIENINKDLPRILQNVDELAVNLRASSSLFKKRVEAIDASLVKIQSFLGLVSGIGETARPFLPLTTIRLVRTASALVKGIRAFTRVLRSREQAS